MHAITAHTAARDIVDQMSNDDRATYHRDTWRPGISDMLTNDWESLDLDEVLDAVDELVSQAPKKRLSSEQVGRIGMAISEAEITFEHLTDKILSLESDESADRAELALLEAQRNARRAEIDTLIRCLNLHGLTWP